MKMIEFRCPIETPKTGWLVMDGKFNMQFPDTRRIEEYESMARRLQSYVKPGIYMVLCVWPHCIYLTSKVHIEQQAKAREVCRRTGHYSVIRCDRGTQEMFN
jgi:hypothetical protein